MIFSRRERNSADERALTRVRAKYAAMPKWAHLEAGSVVNEIDDAIREARA